jgi:hypothetical protein
MVFDMPLDMYSDMPLYDICHAFDTHSVMPLYDNCHAFGMYSDMTVDTYFVIWTFASDAFSIKIIIFIYHPIGTAKK